MLCWAWSSFAQGETRSKPGQAIPGTLGASPFSGSTPAKRVPRVLPLSLQDAINRGLKQNLGALLSSADIRSARGQRWEQLRAPLPHVTAARNVDVSQINLAELGFTFRSPGFSLPPSIGPFSFFDARLNFSQALFDWKLIRNERASRQSLKSAEYTYKDARDLVVLPSENATGNYVKIVQRIPVKIVLEPGENRDRQLRPGRNVVPGVYLQ
jgi:outer membrane protein TolC